MSCASPPSVAFERGAGCPDRSEPALGASNGRQSQSGYITCRACIRCQAKEEAWRSLVRPVPQLCSALGQRAPPESEARPA